MPNSIGIHQNEKTKKNSPGPSSWDSCLTRCEIKIGSTVRLPFLGFKVLISWRLKLRRKGQSGYPSSWLVNPECKVSERTQTQNETKQLSKLYDWTSSSRKKLAVWQTLDVLKCCVVVFLVGKAGEDLFDLFDDLCQRLQMAATVRSESHKVYRQVLASSVLLEFVPSKFWDRICLQYRPKMMNGVTSVTLSEMYPAGFFMPLFCQAIIQEHLPKRQSRR